MSKNKDCENYSKRDCMRFVESQMNEQEKQEFMAHAEECFFCREVIRLATTSWLRQKEADENGKLNVQALSIMDHLDQTVFSIVVRAVKGFIELVQSSGEQMAETPALAGIRSATATDGSDRLKPLRLVKEFEESRLSVEVTLSPVEPDMLDVIVSLLDRKIDEFISDASVTCQGENLQLQEMTGADGQACFRVPAAGFYEVIMKNKAQLLGTMTLNAT